MVEDEMGEESAVLVAARRIMGEIKSIPLEVFPEKLGRKGVVLGPVFGATFRAFEGSSNRVAGFRVTELHATSYWESTSGSKAHRLSSTHNRGNNLLRTDSRRTRLGGGARR